MPGYELIGKEEHKEISELFKKSKTLFRMGFEKNRRGIYKVKDFSLMIFSEVKTERSSSFFLRYKSNNHR